MVFKIKGLDKLQRELKQASEALDAIGGDVAAIKFTPSDPASIERAIADMEQAVDGKLSPYRNNDLVSSLAEQMKTTYRDQILERASIARAQEGDISVKQEAIDKSILRQIENTVTDLRRAELNSFERHIKKLSRLLHSSELDPITRKLVEGIDLNAWLEAGHATQGGIIGSAELEWPSDHGQELGTVVLLIDRFADDPKQALHFAHTFYYNGSKVTNNLRNMTEQVIAPFARDFIEHVKTSTGTAEATFLPTTAGPAARKAFVVHGHDEGAREAVARFLERIGFEAIILHEQANQGRTVIEKIEAHGDVGFAVVLLTPDDVGSVKGGEPQPRARQNVLLELGYFIGRLGRSRVCALTRGSIEIPSDFGGVVYETFDAGNGWKTALARELQAAGFEIDWNRIYGR